MIEHKSITSAPIGPLGRRAFLVEAAASALAMTLPVRATAADSGHENGRPAVKQITAEQLRARTLAYVQSVRVPGKEYGRYRYSTSVPKPTLYASLYAALTRRLYRDLGSLSQSDRQQWIDYIQSHQEDDGLFRDPLIYGQGWYKGDPEWCGRRHLSGYAAMGLTALGAVVQKPLRFLEPFYQPGAMVKWMESRKWRDQPDFVGNEVFNLGRLLQYARDFQHESRAAAAVRTMLDWMSCHHLDPKTSLWGGLNPEEPKALSRAVQGTYHFWLLYFYDRVPIPYPDRAVDYVLRTQNRAGGFGLGVHNPDNPLNSSACEDIDSIHPLVLLMLARPYRREEIRRALERGLAHVLANQNSDGGFVFMRDKAYEYGHPLLGSGMNGSGMFPTWFRTLTLAFLGKALPDSAPGRIDWDFGNCPGPQFWW